MSKYKFELDMNDSNSLSEIIKKIKPNSKVLELGCAHGRLTKYLKENLKCKITIVEIDFEAGSEASKYSEKAFIGPIEGNIEKLEFVDEVASNTFDYIIFADVLEHLKNPKKVLMSMKKLLKDEGSILVSIPNVAHNSILIDLLNDKFVYREIGLLDNTHIHFFTYNSIKEMSLGCDFYIKNISCTVANVGEIEIENSYMDVSSEVEFFLKKREYGNVYQFIVELQNTNSVRKGISSKVIEFEKKRKIDKRNTITQLFYPTVSGFNEQNSLKIEKMEEKLKINLSKNFEEIRFDPSITPGILYLKDTNFKITSSNAIVKQKDILVFTTNDPQIYLKNTGGNIFEISYDFHELSTKELIYFKSFNIEVEKLQSYLKKIQENNRIERNEVREENKGLLKKIEEVREENKGLLKSLNNIKKSRRYKILTKLLMFRGLKG